MEKWIRANGVMPVVGADVLVTTEDRDGKRHVALDWYDGKRFARHEYGKYAVRVVAWAPAPLPYTDDLKEEKGDD